MGGMIGLAAINANPTADPDLLHDMFYGFVDYLTVASLRDGNCSFAGIDNRFTANLGEFVPLPVVRVGASAAMNRRAPGASGIPGFWLWF